MHLKQMDLQGFKSFPDKITLVFDKGVTAIVGPNGSGKSNIADAVRWVLGEQSAKQLRGIKMEDVIFAGTQKRRAVSFCEVTLTFDNEDHGLDIEFTEVSVTRRMYRDGKSEYYLNGSLCRLRDVIDLFRDTGIGKEGYSIIGQGRIDELLSNKPEDRRAAFEEASGVSRFKADRNDALRKLERTEANLVRIDDIIEELASQIEPLTEQKDSAQKYLNLRDDLKYNEINLFVHQAVKYQERIKSQDEIIIDAQNLLDLAEQTRDEIDKSTEYLYEQARIHEEKSIGIREKSLGFTAKKQAIQGSIALANEKVNSYKRDIERIKTENNSREERIQTLISEIQSINEQQTLSIASLAEKESIISSYEEQYENKANSLQKEENALETAKNAVIEHLNQMSDVNTRKARLTAMKSSVEERIVGQEKVVNDLKSFLDSSTSDIEEESKKLIEINSSIASLNEKKNRINSEQQSLAEKISKKNDMLRVLSEEITQIKTRINLLQQMKNDYEGFQSSVRRLLNDAQNDERLKNCIACVVADAIKTEKEYEKAIEVSLGTSLQNIITFTENDAKELIQHLREKSYGRATFLPLNSIHPRYLNTKERLTLSSNNCIGVASDLVTYDSQYKPVIDYLLGRIVIVRSFNDGVKLARRNNSSFRIVTLDGDVLNAGGSITGGSLQNRTTSLLSRDRLIEDEKSKQDSIEVQLLKQKTEIENLQHDVQDRLISIAALNDDISSQNVLAGQYRERIAIMEEAHTDNKTRYNDANDELLSLKEALSDISSDLANTIERSSISEKSTVSDEEIAAMQQMIYVHRTETESLRKTIETLRIGLSHDKADNRNNDSKRDLLNDEVKRLQQELDTNHSLLDITSANVSAAEEEIKTLQNELNELTVEANNAEASLHESDDIRQKLNADLQNKNIEKNAIQKELDLRTDQLHKAEMTKARLETEVSSLHERIWNDYQLTYASAIPLADEAFQLNGAVSRIASIKYEMRELGDVNIGAIEQYTNVSQRLDSMNKERADLFNAKTDLEEVIARFEKEITDQFKSQFDLINKNFKVVFSQLFNGGTADLILTEPENILETGIEIVAQPPGKKLQSLSLLSGGERTLTAIAILFAMLNTKQTPFCVLDEIEAALDEANTDMYAEFLKAYSEKTQFVIITHKKESMEVADIMYGITMQEKGISSVVSVKLTDN